MGAGAVCVSVCVSTGKGFSDVVASGALGTTTMRQAWPAIE